MTLGPKFFCSSKMPVTRRRKHLKQYFLAGSPHLDVSYLSSPSKRDLKHSGTFFRKFACDLGFAAYEKRPLRDDFLTFEMSKKICFLVFFRLWYMQSEAFRYYISFEHSPKPSKHQKHTVFNASNVKKWHFRKNVEKEFWPVLKYVKNTLNSNLLSILPETF